MIRWRHRHVHWECVDVGGGGGVDREKIDGRRSTKVRDDWGSERKLTVAFNLVGGATRGSSPITARSGQ
jgi:hypothetical protein